LSGTAFNFAFFIWLVNAIQVKFLLRDRIQENSVHLWGIFTGYQEVSCEDESLMLAMMPMMWEGASTVIRSVWKY